jgi:signal transduction histidine kinase
MDWALWAVRINCVGLVFIPATFLSFAFAFVGKRLKTSILFFLFSLSFIFLVFSLTTKLFFTDIVYRFWGYYPIGGPINALFAIYLIICVVYGTSLLYISLKRSKGIKRIQSVYVFFGFLIAFGGGFVNLLPVSGLNVYPIGNVINIFYTAIITYAIVKHRLMDIGVIIKKSIVYSGLLGTVLGIYVLLTFLFGQLLQIFIGFDHSLAIFFTALLIVLGYKPLEKLIENTTDKIFFKRKYDYRKSLKELSREISTVIDLQQLFKLIVVGIAKTVRVDKVSMLIRKDPYIWSGLIGKFGTEEEQITPFNMEMDGAFVSYLSKQTELIITEEIVDEDIKSALNKFEASVCVPMLSKKGLLGIINIGDKLSQEPYTLEDLELFITLANQASIALENAKLIQREKEMIHKLEQAERLSSLGRFAAGIAHEIKNPLVSIKTFFQIFSDKEETEEDKQELAELAAQEIIHIEGLLENLLNFAKPSTPEFSFEDINEILKETILLIKQELVLKGAKLIISKETEHIPKIMVDRKQIKQVFLNLIYNSLQAMPDGGEIHITSFYDPAEKELIMRFTDSGYGIAPQEIKKLFDPFYTTKPGGTGMGLAVSYNIIKRHEGEITVKSTPGMGTTFEIRLPVSIKE